MTGRLRGNDNLQWSASEISYLVNNTGVDFQSVTGIEDCRRAVVNHGCGAGENVEKLPRLSVPVLRLRSAWRHAFLNDGQFSRFQKIPAVVPVTPGIMFCVFQIL